MTSINQDRSASNAQLSDTKITILVFCCTIFSSAFLLFQIQPLIGKFILPWFSSSPGVWASCMLFFQLLLLFAYGYAHLLSRLVPSRYQAIGHGCLVILALIALPLSPEFTANNDTTANPTLSILTILGLTISVPYLVLAATGPLMQSWYAKLLPEQSPYRLYALSNIGSLLGLVTYPFLFEPNLDIKQQASFWSISYGFYTFLCLSCIYLVIRYFKAHKQNVTVQESASETISHNHVPHPPTVYQKALWFLLAALASALLLATTNQLSLDVAVVPFLWIIPLCIYLISFILCFDSDRWYQRNVYICLIPLVLINTVRLLYGGIELGLIEQIAGYSLTLFLLCMCLHGELATKRPAPEYLTGFYLFISLGGAVGGFFVAIFSPWYFSGFYEFPVLLCISAAIISTFGYVYGADKTIATRVSSTLLTLSMLAAVSLSLRTSTWLGDGRSSSTEALYREWASQTHLAIALTAMLSVFAIVLFYRQQTKSFLSFKQLGTTRNASIVISCIAITCLGCSLFWVSKEEQRRQIERERDFYGVLAIREYSPDTEKHSLGLRHGRINHGEQSVLHPDWPIAYYGPRSGIGLAIRKHPNRQANNESFHIGVIGLGTGTLASYGNSKIDPNADRTHYATKVSHSHPDIIKFYELSPLVNNWAEEKFSYLSDARKRGADVSIALGDARLVMEQDLTSKGSEQFDVLALDAFSSDAIPMHLLTLEAFQLYLSHLKPGGILALHVSNRFLDVKPIVNRIGNELGIEAIYIKNRGHDSRMVDSSSWMIMTTNKQFLTQASLQLNRRPLGQPGALWTDNYSSLFDALKKQ